MGPCGMKLFLGMIYLVYALHVLCFGVHVIQLQTHLSKKQFFQAPRILKIIAVLIENKGYPSSTPPMEVKHVKSDYANMHFYINRAIPCSSFCKDIQSLQRLPVASCGLLLWGNFFSSSIQTANLDSGFEYPHLQPFFIPQGNF